MAAAITSMHFQEPSLFALLVDSEAMHRWMHPLYSDTDGPLVLKEYELGRDFPTWLQEGEIVALAEFPPWDMEFATHGMVRALATFVDCIEVQTKNWENYKMAVQSSWHCVKSLTGTPVPPTVFALRFQDVKILTTTAPIFADKFRLLVSRVCVCASYSAV